MKKILTVAMTFMFALSLGLGLMPAGELGIIGDNFSQVALAEGGGKQNVFGKGEVIDADVNENKEARGIIKKIKSAANVFAAFVLAISIIMILIGALQYILASGDPGKAEKAKMILIYSFVGIIIALSAFAIARFFASFSF